MTERRRSDEKKQSRSFTATTLASTNGSSSGKKPSNHSSDLSTVALRSSRFSFTNEVNLGDEAKVGMLYPPGRTDAFVSALGMMKNVRVTVSQKKMLENLIKKDKIALQLLKILVF